MGLTCRLSAPLLLEPRVPDSMESSSHRVPFIAVPARRNQRKQPERLQSLLESMTSIDRSIDRSVQ
jgi:hypothetical protein